MWNNPPDSGNPGVVVEENRLKRCLKGGVLDSGTPVGVGFVLVCQGVSRTNICGNHLSQGEIVLVTSDDDILSYYHTRYDTDYVPEM
jgi:hypothetical protein